MIIGIIFLVLANTMIMTARERTREYAVLKTIGFTGRHLATIIAGEAILVALIGGGLGLLITVPICAVFAASFSTFFPIFVVEPYTIAMALTAALGAGIFGALVPLSRAVRTPIVNGLRQLS